MASHSPIGSASAPPLSAALSIIPCLPRPLLARLVDRAIERLDEIAGYCAHYDDDQRAIIGRNGLIKWRAD